MGSVELVAVPGGAALICSALAVLTALETKRLRPSQRGEARGRYAGVFVMAGGFGVLAAVLAFVAVFFLVTG